MLCKITLSITACIFSLALARDVKAAFWILVVGITLDLVRETADRLMGRPMKAAIIDAEAWTADAKFVRRHKVETYVTVGLCLSVMSLIGLSYGMAISSMHPSTLLALLSWVEHIAPDLSPIIKAAPYEAVSHLESDRAFYNRLTDDFVSIVNIVTAIFIFCGTLYTSRVMSFLSADWARKKGKETYTSQAAVVPIYILCFLTTLLGLSLYNRTGYFLCHSGGGRCGQNLGTFFWYALSNGLIVGVVITMASTAESGCLERAVTRAKNSVESPE